MIEILKKDLLGRIARFKTKTGIIETPAFLPVIHPEKLLVPPRQLFETFNCSTIITNAYLLFKNGKEGRIHDLLDFPGSIMTDSGAYQLLVYGQVDVTPTQIIKFQERIETDIAVILDVPTGGYASYQQAKATVKETLSRAKESLSQRSRSDILWVVPIQGGNYPTLVVKSAKESSKLDFPIFAIGSPTQLMESYQFGNLVDLIMAARRNLSSGTPIHLFGAGHPLIFPLIVALGCDMFDSAAYAIYARNNRLLTPDGTYRLNEIYEDFCGCPSCTQYSIDEMKHLKQPHRTRVLAEHNLHVCFKEIARIKQAIREGRLWRLVESRLSNHPSLVNAVKHLINHIDFIEPLSPITKRKALFITSKWSLFQPEIIRHRLRMERYSAPAAHQDALLVLAAPSSRPYDSSPEYQNLIKLVMELNPQFFRYTHVLFLSPYFGIIPLELCGMYPLAQHEIPDLDINNWTQRLLKQLSQYIDFQNCYSTFLGIFPNDSPWMKFSRACTRHLKAKMKIIRITHTNFQHVSLAKAIRRIITTFQTAIKTPQ